MQSKQFDVRSRLLSSLRLVGQRVGLFIAMAALILLGTGLFSPGAEAVASEITVYRDPSCSCCEGWIHRLQEAGFQTVEVQTADVNQIKQQQQVPDDLTSCHTALLNQYVLEGHVPVADIQRLLTDQPDVRGITVPGMPVGTPGMEDGDRRDNFTVYSFGKDGVEVFHQYTFN